MKRVSSSQMKSNWFRGYLVSTPPRGEGKTWCSKQPVQGHLALVFLMKKTLGIFVFEAVELGKFVSRDLGGNTLQLIFVKGAGKNPTLEKKLKVDISLSLSLFFSFYAYNPMHIGYSAYLYIQCIYIYTYINAWYIAWYIISIQYITYVACREPWKTDFEPQLGKNFRKLQLDPKDRHHPTFSTSGGTGFTFLAETKWHQRMDVNYPPPAKVVSFALSSTSTWGPFASMHVGKIGCLPKCGYNFSGRTTLNSPAWVKFIQPYPAWKRISAVCFSFVEPCLWQLKRPAF